MKTFFKYQLLNLIFFSIVANAQSNQKYPSLESFTIGMNFKDSVKSVFFKFNEPKQSLSKFEKDRFIIYNDIRQSIYLSLDKYGRYKTTLDGLPGYTYLDSIDYKKTDDYEYDEKDWAEKNKHTTALQQYCHVRNTNLLLKLNQIEVQKEEQIVGGKVWQQYVEDVYIYIYDKLGRIKEEQEFHVFRFAEIIQDKTPKKEDLFTRKLFTYNAKGQVVNQKIIAGLFAKDKMAYTDLGTECDFCDDLQLRYAYDSIGRITQIIMYGCGEIVDKEEYSYHPTKDYVEKVKCYVTGPGEMSNPTKNFVMTYNEQGDIIKKEFIPNNPEQKLKEKVRYYSYEYDSHNNWIKCNMYLEGTKEGELSLVAERKIEYYN